MKGETAFRRSSYLTLALAAAALAQAEAIFFPELAVFVLPVLAALVLAYIFEGRWKMSNLAANLFGLAISIGFGVWVALQLVNFQVRHGIVAPWWVLIMPFFGPVLMALMLVKLFQPKKTRDYWKLHFIGLMQVILGCVLASQLVFGLLVMAYVISGLWTLTLFYQMRGHDRPAGSLLIVRRTAPARPAAAVRPRRALGWSVLVLGLAFAFFLATPHLGDDSWDPFTLSNHRFLTTGFSMGMDLNRVGSVRSSDRPAFTVSMRDQLGRPRIDLGAEQYWRGSIMSGYDRGRWYVRTQAPTRLEPGAHRVFYTAGPLADLGPAQYFITFALDTQKISANALPLADPLTLPPEPGRPTVVVLSGPAPSGPLFRPFDGNLVQAAYIAGDYTYRQVTVPAPLPGYGPRFERAGLNLQPYLHQPVPGIRSFTRELVQRLRQEGKLSADIGLIENGDALLVQPEDGLEMSRVLARHLSQTGGYTYTLTLRRHDMALDPTEDFLRNVRQGHCARYASALALMTRSLGIPSRVVIGFRGADPTDDAGVFVVKQNMAHSWVEVLAIERGDPAKCRWVRLEPTPADEANLADPSFWGVLRKWSVENWNSYLIDYDSSKRNELLGEVAGPVEERWQHLRDSLVDDPTDASAWLELAGWLAVPGLLLLTWLLVRRGRARAKKSPAGLSPPPLACYHRLLLVLERRFQLRPKGAQTPLEFAAAVADVLAGEEEAAILADVPGQVVRLLYRVQYARQQPDERELAAMDRRVAELDAALTIPEVAR